jgi:hypothetical protein
MMDGGIIPLKAMGGGILAIEDIAAAGIGETPAAGPATTADIHIFGRHSSAETFAELAELSGVSGLPAFVTPAMVARQTLAAGGLRCVVNRLPAPVLR